ncbi:MAG: hypothetical protein K5854_01215 [Prevotella sp.]|nr:hypothetical protein [Prevotella sp.]
MKRILTAFILLSLCFHLTAHAQSLDKSAMRDSLKAAAQLSAYYPDSTDLRLKKAAWNIQLEEWQYALDEYNTILAKEPSNLAALYYRAFVGEKLHRYKFARLDYQNLLQIVPGNFEAQLGLALLNEKDKHLTEAMDGINSLVSQHPARAEGYAARAGIEKGRGMLELAEYDFTEAIKRDPTNTDYILCRADTRIKLKRYKEAREDLDKLVALGISRAGLAEFYKQAK